MITSTPPNLLCKNGQSPNRSIGTSAPEFTGTVVVPQEPLLAALEKRTSQCIKQLQKLEDPSIGTMLRAKEEDKKTPVVSLLHQHYSLVQGLHCALYLSVLFMCLIVHTPYRLCVWFDRANLACTISVILGLAVPVKTNFYKH